MWLRTTDFGVIFIVFAGLLIASYLFSSLPNGFAKFLCAVISIAAGFGSFKKIPSIELALFVGSAVTVIIYLLARLADFLTSEHGSFFKRNNKEKPRYFRPF